MVSGYISKIEGILISVLPAKPSLFLEVKSNTLDALPLIWNITTPCSLLYDTWASLTLIELLYYGYFGAGNNVNWMWLKNNDCWPETHPMNFRYTRSQFEKILREGKIDVGNVKNP